MIIDARNITEAETIHCDICIVGAGAAGITLAHELRNCGMKVVLLESGGMKHDNAAERLNQGEVDLNRHTSLEEYRRRRLGGATTAWGGRCVPFDKSDFEYQSYIPYSGWPITKDDLDPYYKRSNVYCEVGAYTYSVKNAFFTSNEKKCMIPGFKSEDVSIEELYLFSPPTDFGKRYLDELDKTANISIILYANCLKIVTDEEGKNVCHLLVTSFRKNDFTISAKHYILATGGLEATKLLLLSNDIHTKGIGNHSDMLGRFYMGHLNYHFKVQFNSKESIIWDYEKTSEGVYCQRAIAIHEDKRKYYGLLNQRAFLERPDASDPSHKNGVLSATYLTKSILSKQNEYRHLFKHTQNILFDLKGVWDFSYKWINQRILSKRKLPSAIANSKSNLYTFRIDSEQVPNPDSRVTLSDKKDFFGSNQLKVDWQYTELDVLSIQKSVQLIEQALVHSDTGRVESLPDIISLRPQGGHHLGTTRMASSPRDGVVDENCKVHGLNNLYIASSSVFTTSSYANPTLTVIALAIRLADHLKLFYL